MHCRDVRKISVRKREEADGQDTISRKIAGVLVFRQWGALGMKLGMKTPKFIWKWVGASNFKLGHGRLILRWILTLILRRSRTGTVWFYTSTSNKRAAPPKLYTKSLTRDLKHMYSRFTLVRISIKLQAPRFFYIGTGVSLLFRERFLYI